MNPFTPSRRSPLFPLDEPNWQSTGFCFAFGLLICPLLLLGIDYAAIRRLFPDYYYADPRENDRDITLYHQGQYAFPGQNVAIHFSYDQDSLQGSFLIRDLRVEIAGYEGRDIGVHGQNKGTFFFEKGEAISYRGAPKARRIQGALIIPLPIGENVYGRPLKVHYSGTMLYAEMAPKPGKFVWRRGKQPVSGASVVVVGTREQELSIRRARYYVLISSGIIYVLALVIALMKLVPPPLPCRTPQ